MKSLHPLLLLLSLLLASPAWGQQEPSPPPAEMANGGDHQAPVIQRLLEIRGQLVERRKELEELKGRAARERDEEQQAFIKRRLEELPGIIDSLTRSFEQLATGGPDLQGLEAQPSRSFDWKQELVLIAEPILGSLRGLTEKPRKIEHLRSEILVRQQQLETVRKAEQAIAAKLALEPPSPLRERLAGLAEKWAQKGQDLSRAMETAEYQIAALEGGEGASVWATLSESADSFLRGRGLTLAFAAAAVALVWLLSRLLLTATRRLAARRFSGQQRYTRDRTALYIYRISTVVLMVIALLVVFYLRSDLLLLAITLIVVIMTILSLRQALPRYLHEIRTLLDIGPVRVGERLIHNGIPMQVKSVNAFVFLRNPELEGVVRLPLEQVVGMVSRVGDEPWFPTRKGELVLLDDGSIAEVLGQSVERVRLGLLGSVVELPTADFLNLGFRNLSRTSYTLPVTFGVDYGHQAICLEEIPATFRERLQRALAESDFGPHLEELRVEFKEAAANSLDYLILVKMRGGAASGYRAIGRLVQRTLVAVCNERGWGIPFAQLTVHRGSWD